MAVVMLMSVILIAMLCTVAYTLAVYALPFMLGLTAAQFAYHTGSGLIGAGLVGLVAAGAAFLHDRKPAELAAPDNQRLFQ